MQKDIINLFTIFSLILFTSVGSAFAYDRQQHNLAVLEAQAEAVALLPQEVSEVMVEPVKVAVPDTAKQDAAAAADERARLAAIEAERQQQAELAAILAKAEALAKAQAEAEAAAEAEALAQAQAEAEAAALAKKNSRRSRAS